MLKFVLIVLFSFLCITSTTAKQIVIQDGAYTFEKYFSSTHRFETAESPEHIGIQNLPGSDIWFLKSYDHTDNSVLFKLSFDILRWICSPVDVTVSIRYMSELAPISVRPIIAEDEDTENSHDSKYLKRVKYAMLEDHPEGWKTSVFKLDIGTSEIILIEGVIHPKGYFLLDEIIILYTDGDCRHHQITTPPPTTTATPTWTTPTTTTPSTTTTPTWRTTNRTTSRSITTTPVTTTTPSPTTTPGPIWNSTTRKRLTTRWNSTTPRWSTSTTPTQDITTGGTRSPNYKSESVQFIRG